MAVEALAGAGTARREESCATSSGGVSNSVQQADRGADQPNPSKGMAPIFVGGCSRSGTTLLGSILGASPIAVCVPESQFKTAWLGRTQGRSDLLLDRDEVVDSLSASFRFRIWRLDRAELLETLPPTCGAEALMTSLAQRYARRTGRTGARLWIDHTPNNIRYFLRLAETFPNSRFLHIVRDPRGVAASLKTLDWGPNHSHSCAAFWLQQVSFGLGAEAALGDRVRRVRYEDLLRHPERTVRDLCRFVEVDYDPAMLRADGFRMPSYSERQHRLVGRGLEPSRAQAWERVLSHREIEVIEAIVCDMLEYFAYPPRFGTSARPPTTWERVSSSLQDLVRTEVVNRWRLTKRRRRIANEPADTSLG